MKERTRLSIHAYGPYKNIQFMGTEYWKHMPYLVNNMRSLFAHVDFLMDFFKNGLRIQTLLIIYV